MIDREKLKTVVVTVAEPQAMCKEISEQKGPGTRWGLCIYPEEWRGKKYHYVWSKASNNWIKTTVVVHSVVMTNTNHQKQPKEGLFGLQVTVHHRRETEAETKAETTEEHCPTALLPTFCYLSYTTQALLPRDGTTHSGLAPPTSINNGERMPSRHGHQLAWRKQFLSWGSLFPAASSWQPRSASHLNLWHVKAKRSGGTVHKHRGSSKSASTACVARCHFTMDYSKQV